MRRAEVKVPSHNIPMFSILVLLYTIPITYNSKNIYVIMQNKIIYQLLLYKILILNMIKKILAILALSAVTISHEGHDH